MPGYLLTGDAMRVLNFFEIQAWRLKMRERIERAARASRLSTYKGTSGFVASQQLRSEGNVERTKEPRSPAASQSNQVLTYAAPMHML